MIQWTEEGLILSTKSHGESSLIVQIFISKYGKCSGLVKGGKSSKKRAVFQPGNQVYATWKARLPEHLGFLECELLNSRSSLIIEEPLKLSCLSAIVSILEYATAEQEPSKSLYIRTISLLDLIILPNTINWKESYVRWELELLNEIGFGLSLDFCAVTGKTNDLYFVSPKTGRAVTYDAAGKWKDKLLVLPEFLKKDKTANKKEILNGLKLTGVFLGYFSESINKKIPTARNRFLQMLSV